jgi:protein involved in sex pheromone biosynthesis
MRMTKKLILAAGTCLLALSACGHKTDAAENVAAVADNTADQMDANATAVRDIGDNLSANVEAKMDNRADRIENNADAVRDAGENHADAIDAAAKKK